MDVVSGDEFREALDKRIVPTLKGDAWRVCKGGYLIKGRGEDKHLVPAHELSLESKWRTVNLLEENLVPDLVKAYRRGMERCKKQPPELSEFEEPILGFVGKYGLGVTGQFRWAGGREETLRSYIEVMQYVEPLVHLLETLLSGKEAAVRAVLKKCPDIRLYLASAEDVADYLGNDGGIYVGSDGAVYRENDGELYKMGVMEHALTGLCYIVAHWFYELCFPFAIPEPHARRLNQVNTGWGFSNLTGAIFWHLFQLLGAQSRLARCEFCGTVIPNANRNTRFCRNNKACHNAYYYEFVTRGERGRHSTDKD